MAYITCDACTWKAEAGRSQVQRQSELCSETLSKAKMKNINKMWPLNNDKVEVNTPGIHEILNVFSTDEVKMCEIYKKIKLVGETDEMDRFQ